MAEKRGQGRAAEVLRPGEESVWAREGFARGYLLEGHWLCSQNRSRESRGLRESLGLRRDLGGEGGGGRGHSLHCGLLLQLLLLQHVILKRERVVVMTNMYSHTHLKVLLSGFLKQLLLLS